MFINNKYTKWYYNIIYNAQRRVTLDYYFENHHIIPKSLNGGNNKCNIVSLTAREHFICHILLTKMTIGLSRKKMIYAARLMGLMRNGNQHRYINPRLYESIKIKYSKQLKGHKFFGPFKQSAESNQKRSEKLKGTRLGKDNPFYGKKHSIESQQKMKAAAKNRVRSEEHKQKIALANKRNGFKRRGKILPKILCCGKWYDPGNLSKHRKSFKCFKNYKNNSNR